MTSSTKRILHDRPMNAFHVCNGAISYQSPTVLRTVPRTLLVRIRLPGVSGVSLSARLRRRARARLARDRLSLYVAA